MVYRPRGAADVVDERGVIVHFRTRLHFDGAIGGK